MKKSAIKSRLRRRTDFPAVIPPRSLVILAQVDARQTPEWVVDLGRIFRIGFYKPADGLTCIWLVNSAGEYEQTIDRKTLLDHFLILQLSDEKDLFGARRQPLKSLGRIARPSQILTQAAV